MGNSLMLNVLCVTSGNDCAQEGILNGQNNGVDYVSILPPLVAVDARYDNLKTAEKELLADLDSLKKVKVRGVMVDCWWGIVEAERPGQYNWDGYKKLFSVVRTANLELHVSFTTKGCFSNLGSSYELCDLWGT
jgi:beta-amylase